uniref:Movement protein n=1 Tax=Lilac leaf chlorosis virus TaxID=722755 RepID=A0A3Q8AVS8_9BROM|nr:movement protein [Lilac leaf chlorosis virus]
MSSSLLTPSSDFTMAEVSMSELQQVSKDLHELMLSNEMRLLPSKGCHVLHLENQSTTHILDLESREQRGLLQKTSDKLRKKIYRDVGRMFFVYVPFIQKSSGGVLTMKLQNSDTGEVSDIITDTPANSAFVLMDRWGRSLVSKAKLRLCYSIFCPDLRPGARVGELVCFWDETMSQRQVYSERGNPIMFPIEETNPAQYLQDKKLLLSMVRARIQAGSTGSDVDPSVLRVERLSNNRKVLMLKPKGDGSSTSGLKVEEVQKEGTQEKGRSIMTTDEFVKG